MGTVVSEAPQGRAADPARPGRLGALPTVVVASLWVAVATVATLFRTTTSPGRSFWAEDGSIFYSDAVRFSFFTTLRLAYNGYLQTGSRLVAAVAVPFGTRDAPLWMEIFSSLAVALLSVYVWRAASDVFRSRWAAVLSGALLVLVPQSGPETSGAVSDLHWYLDICCFWAVVRPPRTWGRVVSSSVVVALAVLSDPLAAVMLLPAAIALVTDRPNRLKRLVVLAVFAASGLTQLGMGRSGSGYWTELSLPQIARFGALRIGGAMVVGERWIAPVYDHFHYLPAGVISVVGLVVVVLVLRRVGGWTALTAAGWLVTAAVLLVVCLRTRGGELQLSDTRFSYDGSRYTLVPVLLIWAAGVYLLDHWWSQSPATGDRRRWGWLAGVVIGASLASNWVVPNLRPEPILWSTQLAQARSLCTQSPDQRQMPKVIDRDLNSPRPQAGPGEVSVLANPHSAVFHDFEIVIPCSKL